MAQSVYHFRDGQKGIALTVRVTLGAKKNEIVEILKDGTLRVRLTVHPGLDEDESNQVLCDYLAMVLGVSKKNIEIVGGLGGKDKIMTILEIDPDQAQQKILEIIP